MKLSEIEIEQAIIEYLAARGVVGVVASQVTISHVRVAAGDVYSADVGPVDLPIREGVY